MSRTGYRSINMKSRAFNTNTLVSDTIYYFNRHDGTLDIPDYSTEVVDAFADETIHPHGHGMIFQNRTTGKCYLWYGPLPVELQVPTEFKKAALMLDAGEKYIPPCSQHGLLYVLFATPSGGYIQHLYH